MRARVLIRPKEGILDPQGQAVERALPALGFEGVANVHIGRLVELDVEDPARVPEMCERLLANPLIEEYEVVEDRAVRFGVVRFPGSCDEVDALMACRRFGDAELLWHRDRDLDGIDAVVVPGGFSYGDYLRAGAIARFSPLMESVIEFARDGGPVLGICNGFQVLCEAGLLPGALLPNDSLRFVCRQVERRGRDTRTPSSRAPASRATCSRSPSSTRPGATTRRAIAPEEQVVLRYAPGQNPNGSQDDIAGVCNEARNVLGLMPHPEHAVDMLTGSTDGGRLFESLALVAA